MKRMKSLFVLFCLVVSFVLPNIKTNAVKADTMVNLTSGVAINATITSNGENTYQFTTNQDGQVYITLDQSSAGLAMELLDSSGNSEEYEYFYDGGETATIDMKLVKGTYYIKIKPVSWDGITSASYRLKATYAGTITRDSKTFEPNETFETAYPINSGQFYSSKLESVVDKDTYEFTTNKDGQVYLTLDQSTAGFSMRLYDSLGNYIEEEYFYNGGETTSMDVKVQKGTYYVVIRPVSWNGITNASYRLKATYAGMINRDGNLETNDTIETAYPVISGKSYTSNSFSKLDRDYYKISTSKSGNVKIKLDKSSDGFIISLYDTFGNYIEGEYYYDGGQSALIDMTLAKGTYYIKVTPYDWNGVSNSNYRLTTIFPDKTPTVNPVSNLSTTISGSAELNAKVYAYTGNTLLGTATAINGKYTINIAKQKAGTSISVYLIDSTGIRSGNRYVTVLDTIAPIAPTVNKITNKSTIIIGKTEASANVYAYNGSKLIGSSKADSKGNYKIKIKAQKKGSTIKIYAMDASKNKSATKSVKVY